MKSTAYTKYLYEVLSQNLKFRCRQSKMTLTAQQTLTNRSRLENDQTLVRTASVGFGSGRYLCLSTSSVHTSRTNQQRNAEQFGFGRRPADEGRHPKNKNAEPSLVFYHPSIVLSPPPWMVSVFSGVPGPIRGNRETILCTIHVLFVLDRNLNYCCTVQ